MTAPDDITPDKVRRLKARGMTWDEVGAALGVGPQVAHRISLRPESDPANVLTNTTAAELAGVRPSTWRDYVADGRAPAPDGRVGRTPWWRRSTVEAWIAARPGRGARTDLRDPSA